MKRAAFLLRAAYVEVLRHLYRNHPIGWYMGPPVIDAQQLFTAIRNEKKR